MSTYAAPGFNHDAKRLGALHRRQTCRSLLVPVTLLLLLVPQLHGQSRTEPVDPSFKRILVGTTIGAIVGVALVAGPPVLFADQLDDPRGSVSGPEIVFAFMAPIGWWLGQAAGASRGASGGTNSVRMREMLGPAALWTVAGAAVGISRDPNRAMLGLAGMLVGTSWSAYRLSRSGRASTEARLDIAPIVSRRWGVGLRGSMRLPR